jgi:hypothetical protein
MPVIIKCKTCGREFSCKPSRKMTAKYCSVKCRTDETVTINCKKCGKPFTKKQSDPKIFCSATCYHSDRNARNDLTGQRFGMLRVVSRISTKSGRLAWQCLCDCGRLTVIRSDALTAGKTTSCGVHFVRDLVGKLFGRLTVIKREDNNSRGRTRWLCRCDCGKELIVLGNSLNSGNTQSCGCYKDDVQRIDFRGQQIGRLTVLEPADGPSHVKNTSLHWLCSCECGNAVTISADSLRKALIGGKGKGARSCGCFNRESASQRMTRELNPNWRSDWTDQQRKENTAPRRTKGYIKWCRSVYRKDNFTCGACGRRGGVLHAHHLEGWGTNKTVRYEISNGITLCKKCHRKFHKSYGLGNNNTAQFTEFVKGLLPNISTLSTR